MHSNTTKWFAKIFNNVYAFAEQKFINTKFTLISLFFSNTKCFIIKSLHEEVRSGGALDVI